MVFTVIIQEQDLMISSKQLIEDLTEARNRTLELVSDLTDEQLMGPQLDIINPLLWEIGHVAWFHEKWILRHLWNQGPVREGRLARRASRAPGRARLPERRDSGEA